MHPREVGSPALCIRTETRPVFHCRSAATGLLRGAIVAWQSSAAIGEMTDFDGDRSSAQCLESHLSPWEREFAPETWLTIWRVAVAMHPVAGNSIAEF